MKKVFLFIISILPALLVSSDYPQLEDQQNNALLSTGFKSILIEAKNKLARNALINVGMSTGNIALGLISLSGAYLQQPVITITGSIGVLVMSSAQLVLNCMCCCQKGNDKDEECGDL